MTEIRRRQVSVEEVAEEAKEVMESPVCNEKVTEDMLIPTGSTMLNLACSGFSPNGGYMKGSVVHLVGDTSTGKTLLCLSTMAEVARDPRFDGYNLIYEEPESRMYFDLQGFGDIEKRVEFIPTDEERVNPRTVQDWHNSLVKAKHPFIWVTDSFDSLAMAATLGKEDPGKGGYDVEKAIVASATYPKIIGPIKSSGSLLIIISQTRDNIGVTFGERQTFSGGKAIKFYRCHEIWLAKKESIKKDVRGKKREIGADVLVKVKKNNLTGKKRQVGFQVYDDLGVDDVGSMVDWMAEEGFWAKKKGGVIETEDGFVDGRRDEIIRDVEEKDLEPRLRQVVAECWRELEGEIRLNRKPRY